MFRTVPLCITRSFSLYTQQWCMSYRFADAPDDGQRNGPEHVEFYSKNKFQKLMHLVGFIVTTFCLFSAICGFCSWLGDSSTEMFNYCIVYLQENVLTIYLSRPRWLYSTSYFNYYSQQPDTRRYTKCTVDRMSLNQYNIL